MELDASSEIPYLNLDPKGDSRTQKGFRAYNSGLCQSQARRKARQHGQIGNSVVSALGLTAASFFIPPLAESAGVAWAGAFAIRSIDTYYAVDAGIDAYNKCKPQLDQFHTIVQAEAKSPDSFCPKSSDPTKAIALKNVYECEKGIVMAIPAALPIVTAVAKDAAALRRGSASVDSSAGLSGSKRGSPETLPVLYGDSFAPVRYKEDVARDGSAAIVVGGKNSSETIKKATGISGLDWKTLDDRAKATHSTAIPSGLSDLLGVKPKDYWAGASNQHLRSSGQGFITDGQTVQGLLIKDNDWVLSHRLTHQEVSDPLIRALKQFEDQNKNVMTEAAGLIEKTPPVSFKFNGEDYSIESLPVGGWYGQGATKLKSGPVGHSELQGSFFNDDYFTNYAVSITNKKTGKKLICDGLTPYLIYRYGFYQGGEYRLAPETIAKFFGLAQ